MSLPRPYYDDGAGIQIFLGDCRDILPDMVPDVIVTDPPYGIGLNSSMNGRHGDCGIANDEDVSLRRWMIQWASEFCPMLIFGSPKAPRPLNVRTILIWDKGEHVGMGDLSLPWKPNWEEIYVFGTGFTGARTTSVLRYLAVAGCVGTRTWRHHPTEKPESLMAELIRKCPAGTILDPFAGSCTTAVAAKNLGRKCICIEVEEKYCEIGARRLAQTVLPLEA